MQGQISEPHETPDAALHKQPRSAPEDLIEFGRALKFNAGQRVLRIYLPSATPSIATGMHLGLIYAWLATVGAEYFLAVGRGVGGLVIALATETDALRTKLISCFLRKERRPFLLIYYFYRQNLFVDRPVEAWIANSRPDQ